VDPAIDMSASFGGSQGSALPSQGDRADYYITTARNMSLPMSKSDGVETVGRGWWKFIITLGKKMKRRRGCCWCWEL
jgi:hypothetical protein